MADELKMLDELEALEKKATPGPWRWGFADFSVQLCCEGIVTGEEDETGQIVCCDNGRGSGDMSEEDSRFVIAARNALPTLLRLARRGLAAGEVVEEIAETCENLQRAAMLNVGDYIHVQGLRGGVEKIKAMADAALARLAEKEER